MALEKKTYENAAMVYPTEPKLKTYSDQTGRFLHRLSKGNKYLMIMYIYDSNAILAVPMNNQEAKNHRSMGNTTQQID